MELTALILGFAGSLHCLGMCSPLIMAVTATKPGALLNRTVYNAGRILTYACMGAVVSGVAFMLPLHRFQNILSILLGVVLLVIGLGGLRSLKIPIVTSLVQRLTLRLKNRFAHHLKQKTRGAIFMLGALNGVLPCGLTIIALTWCLTLRGPLDGFNFMLLFGAGTLPVMLGLTGILPALARKRHWNIHRLTTSMIILSGCVLIARVFLVHLPHEPAGNLMEIIMCQ